MGNGASKGISAQRDPNELCPRIRGLSPDRRGAFDSTQAGTAGKHRCISSAEGILTTGSLHEHEFFRSEIASRLSEWTNQRCASSSKKFAIAKSRRKMRSLDSA